MEPSKKFRFDGAWRNATVRNWESLLLNSEQNHFSYSTKKTSCATQHRRIAPELKMATKLDSLTAEEKRLIEVLRANAQLLETDDENATVPSGVTHIPLFELGEKPRLIPIFP